MGLVHDLSQAAVIMTIGMTVTFVFLAALILAIQISSRVIARYAPDTVSQKDKMDSLAQVNVNGAVLAAITIAVKKYRDDNKNKKS